MKNIIDNIKKDAKQNLIPIVRDNTLNAMLELIKLSKPNKILEIGTAVGYSALNMLECSKAQVTTIEKDENRAKQAQENFKKANLCDRVTLYNDDAIVVLSQLCENNEKFDFVFLDGPKGQYIKYLPYILTLLNENGYVFADNVGLLGLVADKEKVNHKNRTMVRNMQAFLQSVTTDERLFTKVYAEDDGYAIIQKITKNDRNT